MTPRPGPASQTWRTLLRNHACELIAGGVYADMRTRIRARLARMIRAFQHRLEERSDGSSRPSLTRDGVVPVLRSADVFTRPLQALTHTSIHAWQERSPPPSPQAARDARLCDAHTACAWTPDVRLMVYALRRRGMTSPIPCCAQCIRTAGDCRSFSRAASRRSPSSHR
jgi:hypothetical protein